MYGREGLVFISNSDDPSVHAGLTGGWIDWLEDLRYAGPAKRDILRAFADSELRGVTKEQIPILEADVRIEFPERYPPPKAEGEEEDDEPIPRKANRRDRRKR